MSKLTFVFFVSLLIGCGKEAAIDPGVHWVPSTATVPPTTTNADGTITTNYLPRYPYSFTLICDGKYVGLIIHSSAEEPPTCPNQGGTP